MIKGSEFRGATATLASLFAESIKNRPALTVLAPPDPNYYIPIRISKIRFDIYA